MNVYPIRCRISAEAGVTRVDVYDDIGEGGWFSDGVTAKGFAAQLSGVKGALEVHINSGGGDVFDGIAIKNAITAHKGPVTTVVDGIAASIASVIAQAGADRVMQPGSMMMIHDAFGLCVGDAAEMSKFADTLDQVSANLAGIYAERAGGAAAGWRDAMRDESWYTAEDAVKAGLADRVGDGQAELPSGLDVAAFGVPGRIAAALRKLPRAADTTHGAVTTDGHSHEHQDGAGGTHAHDHSHDGDGDHGHAHDGDGTQAAGHAHSIVTDAAGQFCSQCGAHLTDDDGRPIPGVHPDAQIRAIVRDELHIANAAVDESSWDGPAAMSAASKSDDPAAALAAICAGRRDGDPKTQAAYALPHHKHQGDPPNRAGVTAALGRIGQTQGLTNTQAAEAHLEAHRNAMGSGADDHEDAGLNWSPDRFRASLERKDK